MAFDIPASFIFLFPLFLFMIMLFNIITRSKLITTRASSLPPGPKKLPFVGNLHQLLFSFQPFHRTLRDLALKHGSAFHLQLGEISTVIISSPEGAKEVMNTHDITFANRPSTVASEILFYNGTDIGFSSYGSYWRQLRKICTTELLSMRRVQSFKPLREREYSDTCRWIASKQGSPINLTESITSSICNVVMQATFGTKSKELASYAPLVKSISVALEGFYLVDLYPSIKLFQVFSLMRAKAERTHKLTDAILERVIKDHKEVKDDDKKQEDLVDVLLKFNEPGHELFLTTENIKAIMQDMFFAGTGTSSSVIDWVMAELLKHPRVLEKAQNEVRSVFNDQGIVDESKFDELKYLKLVIKETLRLHPPGPLLLPRVNSECCEILGYKIPAKTRVMINVWAIARDSNHWIDAENFIPERFLDSSIDYKGNNFEYLPFGGGRRMCPGISFGVASMELLLSMFLYHFDWVLPHGMKPENVDMTEAFALTVARKNPLYAIPIPKKPILVK